MASGKGGDINNDKVSWGGRGLSRREFLRAGGAAFLVTASAAGCDFLSTDPAKKKEGAGSGSGTAAGAGPKGKEAPMLAEMVRQGKLPPVEERLPEKPLVVEPMDRMGVYGGEWNTGLLGPADTPWLDRTIGYDYLIRWETNGFKKVIPNLAEEYEANEDGTEYTFRLRRGIRWSDGKPFTADDIVFAQNDVLNNEQLGAGVPWSATAEKVDDYTVRIIHSEPNSLFLQELATPNGGLLTTHPRHYFERFHKKYNPDAERLVKEEGAADWVDLFENKGGGITGYYDTRYQNPDLPTLFPWILTTALGKGNRVVAERNPYYWKVDPDGSQLPYLDRVIYGVFQDEEVMLTRALNGDFDMHVRHFNILRNKPVLADNTQRGNYRLFDTVPSLMNTAIIALNLAHRDEAKREIFNNKDFRIGLSHAINRQEIIDTIFVSQGQPWQAAPRPDSEFYSEELAEQYTEYSVEKANNYLDRAGYSERNGQGIRLGPDGDPIAFSVEVASGAPNTPDWVGTLELVQGYWRKVGIDMSVRTIDRTLFYERKEYTANRHDANVWSGDGGLDVILEGRWYFPFDDESNFATPWAQWRLSEGEQGEEPPEPAKRQMALYSQLQTTTDEAKRAKLMRQILQIAKEQFWVIGISLSPPGFGIAKNDLHNVPQEMIEAYLWPTPAPTNPEQYFFGDA